MLQICSASRQLLLCVFYRYSKTSFDSDNGTENDLNAEEKQLKDITDGDVKMEIRGHAFRKQRIRSVKNRGGG